MRVASIFSTLVIVIVMRFTSVALRQACPAQPGQGGHPVRTMLAATSETALIRR
jgi:hypothetical protein